MTTRRSPRNHEAVPTFLKTNLNVKAADVPWANEPELEQSLVSAMQSSQRWRNGLFDPKSESLARMKNLYYAEIAQAIFSRNASYSASYERRSTAFARAVKDRIEHLLITHQPQTRSKRRRISSDSYAFWTNVRNDLPSANSTDSFWTPSLPEDLQREIAVLAACSMETCHDFSRSSRGSLRLVNSTWCHFVTATIFSRVFLNSRLRYHQLVHSRYFDNHEFPLKYVRNLVVSVPPVKSDLYALHQTGHYIELARAVQRLELDGEALEIWLREGDPAAKRMSMVDKVAFRGEITATLLFFVTRMLQPTQVIIYRHSSEGRAQGNFLYSALGEGHLNFNYFELRAEEVAPLTTTDLIRPHPEQSNDFRTIYYETMSQMARERKVQGANVVVRGDDICHLALISTTIARMPVGRISLVDWDSEEAKNLAGWRAMVESERKFTGGPPWDPEWKIRWLTNAEWLAQRDELQNGYFGTSTSTELQANPVRKSQRSQ